jgi:nitrite reductase/ring-hydroxylating ferredoxin subunit
MWVKVLDAVPKEGTMVATTLEGVKIFVTMNNGALYAAENRCPHEDIELTLGCLKANQVKCSLHGYSFDLAASNTFTHMRLLYYYEQSLKETPNTIFIQF